VSKVIQKRGGVFTAEFLRLASHYLFAYHFCLVRRPNEKGHTEALVGYARRNYMVPVPVFDDFEVFNEQLANSCREDLQRKLRGTTGTKAELLEDDRQAMLPLPQNAFEVRRWSLAKSIRCRWCDSIATTTRCRRRAAGPPANTSFRSAGSISLPLVAELCEKLQYL
jgi:hypothetical protein